MESPSVKGTPLASKDLRRRTLLKNASGATPLRRQSIQTPNVTLPEKSNDESERSDRRSLIDIQRRLSNIPQPNTSLSLSDLDKSLGEKDGNDHIQICAKLYTANKITAKNAWKLKIIDLLKNMIQKPRADILQVASTSLDIGARVYGIRVDTLHADGLKLASSMAKISNKDVPHHHDNDNVEDETLAEEETPVNKPKKKKKLLLEGDRHSISKDPKHLRQPLSKLESALFSTRTNAETSTIENLLTNMLTMDNTAHKFIFLTDEIVWPHEPDPLVKDVNNSEYNYPFAINYLQDTMVCSLFNNFEVDEWNPDEEEKQLAEEKSALSQQQEEVVCDDNGIPIHELDGSVCNIFENGPQEDDEMIDGDDIQSIHEEIAPQLRGEVANIVEFRPDLLDGTKRSEYSYNSVVNVRCGKVIDQIWAGPSHWKVKYIKRSSVRFSGQVSAEVKQSKQGKRKVQPQVIDYFEECEYDMKKLKIKKKPPTVDIHKITLPIPDTSCIKLTEHLNELMIKPGVCPLQKKADANNQIDYEVSTYKYDNPNDSQYCSQQTDADNGDDGEAPFDDSHEKVEGIEAQHEFLDHLVDAPETILRSFVPYALQAKKMDMKKLKAAVWYGLTKSDVPPNGHFQYVKIIPATFSKIYQELPDHLTEKMKQELSCPLAFFALLHLCNEQNLQLHQHPGYKDFDIRGPSR